MAETKPKVRGKILLSCENVPWFGDGFQPIELVLTDADNVLVLLNGSRADVSELEPELHTIRAMARELDAPGWDTITFDAVTDDAGGVSLAFRGRQVYFSRPYPARGGRGRGQEAALAIVVAFDAICSRLLGLETNARPRGPGRWSARGTNGKGDA